MTMVKHVPAAQAGVLSFLVAVTILVSPGASLGAAQPGTAFIATGYAAASNLSVAKRVALENALWLAVYRAADQVLAPSARADRAKEIRRVLARPRDFVTGYTIVRQGPSRGRYAVVVRASVDLPRLRRRFQAIGVPTVRNPLLASQQPTVQDPSASQPPVPQAGPPTSRPEATVKAILIPTAPSKAPSPAPAAAARKMRIAVLPLQQGFTNPEWANSWNISVGVTEMIEEALFRTERFRIVERRQLEEVLKEQGLGQSGTLDPSTMARVGRVLGIEAFITGSVNQFELTSLGAFGIPPVVVGRYRAQVGLTARVVNTSTAEVTAIVRASGQSDGTLVIAQLDRFVFGGGEFKNTVLGRALDQAIQDLTGKLIAGLERR